MLEWPKQLCSEPMRKLAKGEQLIKSRERLPNTLRLVPVDGDLLDWRLWL